MPALHFTLYPRVVDLDPATDNGAARRAASIVGDLLAGPAILGGGDHRIRFSDSPAGPPFPSDYPESDPALCVHLRLLKLDDPAAPTAAERLTLADVGVGGVQVAVVWTTNTTSPSFQTTYPAFSANFTSTSPFSADDENGNFVFETIAQFDAASGLFRIYVDPSTPDWAANTDNFKLTLVIRNGLAQSLSAVFTVAAGTNAQGAPDVAVLSRPWLHFIPPAVITAAGDEQSASILNFGTTFGTGSANVGASPLVNVSTADLSGNTGITVTSPSVRVDPGTPAELSFGTSVTSGNPSATFALAADLDDVDPLGDATPPDGQLTDALHRRTFAIDAELSIIELLLVLDASGSMGWELGSDVTAPAGRRRWDYLVEGLEVMRQILINHRAEVGDGDRLAVAIFPQSDTRRFGPDSVDTVIGDVLTQFGTAFNPLGGTPMRLGLEDGLALYPGLPGANQRRLLLMTDGAWNTGGEPLVSPAILGAIRSAAIPTVAVRLGNQAGLGQTTLNVMTSGNYNVAPVPGAEFFTGPPGVLIEVDPGIAAADTDPDEVNKSLNFVANLANAAASTLGLRENADPGAIVSDESPTAFHEFKISELDRNATVLISWITRDFQRIDVRLQTPLCEDITAGVEDPNVNFSSGECHQQFHFNEAFLRGEGAAGPRFGTWRLFISLNSGSPASPPSSPPILLRPAAALPGPDQEPYEFRVWSNSHLRFTANLDPRLLSGRVVSTTDDLGIQARLSSRGIGLPGAAVTAVLNRPTNSFASFLAETPVDPELLERVRKEQIEAGVVDPWEIKRAALAAAGVFFVQKTEDVSLVLDDRGGGKYAGEFPSACVPGNYLFRVIAEGSGDIGSGLHTEASFALRVFAVLDADNTSVSTELDSPTSGRVCWNPRDACGNPILYNPVLEQPFVVRLSGGRFVGDPVALPDATYCQPFELDGQTPPVVIITAPDSEEPIIQIGLPHLPELIFCDKVVRHEPGHVREANRHADPEAALGPFTSQGDEFLSLGASGSVILAARKASNPTSVCVIVREEPGDLRPYSVEICTAKKPSSRHLVDHCDWIEVGRSRGVTECFALGHIKHAKLGIVRIRDLSRRASDGGKPLERPGTSVFAVGFEADPPAPSVRVEDCVIGATSSLQLRDRCRLLQGKSPTAQLFNSGSGESLIGVEAKLGSVFSSGDVRANQRAVINGDVWTRGRFIQPHTPPNPNNPTVTGTVRTGVNALVLPGLAQFIVAFPPPTDKDVRVGRGKTVTLAAGSYRHISLAPEAKLILSAGRYFCESLQVDVGARLELPPEGLVEIQMAQALTWRGAVSCKDNRCNLLIVSSASATSFVEAPFRGTLVAPNGSLKLQGSAPHKVHHGAFYARNLVIEPDWTIVHVPC